ncbi:F-box protein At5g49610-like [Andrographis paniculata]|uniref:F-box protein At5g49610-like n=1 Tax=Andrographis paniculata TaxID=175694 RepID=UPI0021E85517|nr:F-box protein At5g49610-like [Andrographis paniculata]
MQTINESDRQADDRKIDDFVKIDRLANDWKINDYIKIEDSDRLDDDRNIEDYVKIEDSDPLDDDRKIDDYVKIEESDQLEDDDQKIDDYVKIEESNVDDRKVDDYIPFPPCSKKKEDMEIKDVIKDHVLCFLPAKSLVRFRSVSKDWDHRIRSPFLAHQQSYLFDDLSGYFYQDGFGSPSFVPGSPSFLPLDSAYGVPAPSLEFLPEPVYVQSASHGLLLCRGYSDNNAYYVCNPANMEWTELPESLYYHGMCADSGQVLAFEPSELNMGPNYWVISAVPLLDQPIVCFELYSSQTMSWRRSKAICYDLGGSPKFVGGLYIDGMAYWQTLAGEVLVFDLGHEVCGVVPLPDGGPSEGVLANVDGELGYIGVSSYTRNVCHVNVYGGPELSLRRRINVQLQPVTCRIVYSYRILPSGERRSSVVRILGGGYLYCYNLKARALEMVVRVEEIADSETSRFLPYVNSLVRLA